MSLPSTAAHPPALIILNSPHIVGAIFASIDRSSLVTCLRVCKQFYSVASPILYDVVRLDSARIGRFFAGAIRIHDQSSRCDWCGRRAGGKLNCVNTRSLKARLLARVRVLSLASHHVRDCRDYGEMVSTLLTGLETIRVVPTPICVWELESFCWADDEGCGLLDSDCARKVVVRNIDSDSEGLSFLKLWRIPSLKELVFVLSPVYPLFVGDRSLFDLHKKCEDRASVKIVFDYSWETWKEPAHCRRNPRNHPATSHQCGGPYRAAVAPTDVHNLIDPKIVVKALFGTNPRAPQHPVAIYGLELLKFGEDEVLLDEATQQRWQRQITDEILALAAPPPRLGARPVRHRANAGVTFGTDEDYWSLKLDPEDRMHELDDGWDDMFW